MINAVSLLNDIKQPEFIKQTTDKEYTGDRFAFSSMLQNVMNEEYHSQPNNEVRETSVQNSSRMEDVSENDRDTSIEETEIELTLEEINEAQSSNNVFAGLDSEISMPKSAKHDFGENNKYTSALAGLGSFVKKNIEITDGRQSAVNLLNMPNKAENVKTAKIKIKDLDVRTKNQVTDIMKKMQSGKISESAAMNVIAQMLADSPAGSRILNSKGKSKNVKVTAKIEMKSEKNINTINMAIPQTRMSKTEQPLYRSEMEIKETKTHKTTNTEVSRKYEKTKTKLSEGQFQQLSTQTDNKELVTEFTLKTETVHDSNEKDIKTVLSDNKRDIFNKMVENTKTIQSQNMTKFSMVMRPESVGRMDFHLTMKDGKLDGRIILQNSEAADFFRANIEELTAVFRKANVELGKLDVSLAGRQFNSEAQTFAGGQSSGGGQSYSRETLETVQAVSHLAGRAVSAYESHATPAAGNSIGNNR
ncbi:MAG: flagellar hook-length control protein FliK, partial [Spirochaetales bacterium]|nr:flagellar hook-length control protein FliK [Spirochaetales bacterium]